MAVPKQFRHLMKKTLNPKLLIKDWKLFKGDYVRVTIGRFRGAEGHITEVIRKKNQIKVENVNPKTKMINGKPTTIIHPIHYSQVQLLHPETNKPIRVQKVTEKFPDGQVLKYRLPKNKNVPKIEIPFPDIPVRNFTTGQFDTSLEAAFSVTFEPNLKENPIPSDCAW